MTARPSFAFPSVCQTSATTNRVRRRGQGGFTLLELLVTIAILGVLSGVGAVSVGHLRSKAQAVALDQSLQALATAVESKMILEDITDLRTIDPNTIDIRNTDNIDFTAFDVTTDSATVQARFKGAEEPCRQIHFPESVPGPCDELSTGSEIALGAKNGSSSGAAARSEASVAAVEQAGDLKHDEEAKKQEAASVEDSKQAAIDNAANSEDEMKLLEEKKRLDMEAAESAKRDEEARKKAEAEKAQVANFNSPPKLTGSVSKFSEWKGQKNRSSSGKWVGFFTVENPSREEQCLDITVVATDHKNSRNKSDSDGFCVPAGRSRVFEVPGNRLSITSKGAVSGVLSVEVVITRVTTTDMAGKKISIQEGLSRAKVEYPKIPD